MKTKKILIAAALTGLLIGCSTAVPQELSDARVAYMRASTGNAAKVAPAELHVANQALEKAEKSFEEYPDSYITRDLAYIAERKALVAEATASIIIERASKSQANSDYRLEQSDALSETKQNLSDARQDLSDSQQNSAKTKEQLEAEKTARLSAEKAQVISEQARLAAEKKATEALAALAKLAAVKEEPRGVVITLSGSVLFRSDKSDLLPDARTRLNQVAAVLLTTRERHLMVEGYTDSQGSDAYNLDLSQRRADAVRSYLIQQDYQASRIEARGLGEGQPVASNDNAEGRANNRRVEIIIQPETLASNK